MNRAELVKTLELVKPALATNNMVPIFQCFVFGMGMVEAYDDTIGIRGPCDIESEFAIHGNTLLGLLSNGKTEEASIEINGNAAILTMGKTVSKLPFHTKDNFIFEAPTVDAKSGIPFTESLAEALKTCLETVSSDATQAALLGISIVGDNLYSCNGDSLTWVKLKKGIKGRTLLPTAFCEATLKLWSALKITKGTLCMNDEWVAAELGDWSVYGRILEVAEPIDFEALITRNLKTKTALEGVPDDFSEALSRARVLSDPESQKTVITVSKGKLQLVTETHMGEVKDVLTFSKSHPEVVANVNASHLQRAIAHCDQIAFHENCVLLEKAPDVLMLVSNMS